MLEKFHHTLEKTKLTWQAQFSQVETSFFSTSLPKFLYLSSFEARKPVVACIKTPRREVTTSLSLGCFLQVPSSTANRALLALSWDTLASISCISGSYDPKWIQKENPPYQEGTASVRSGYFVYESIVIAPLATNLDLISHWRSPEATNSASKNCCQTKMDSFHHKETCVLTRRSPSFRIFMLDCSLFLQMFGVWRVP